MPRKRRQCLARAWTIGRSSAALRARLAPVVQTAQRCWLRACQKQSCVRLRGSGICCLTAALAADAAAAAATEVEGDAAAQIAGLLSAQARAQAAEAQAAHAQVAAAADVAAGHRRAETEDEQRRVACGRRHRQHSKMWHAGAGNLQFPTQHFSSHVWFRAMTSSWRLACAKVSM